MRRPQFITECRLPPAGLLSIPADAPGCRAAGRTVVRDEFGMFANKRSRFHHTCEMASMHDRSFEWGWAVAFVTRWCAVRESMAIRRLGSAVIAILLFCSSGCGSAVSGVDTGEPTGWLTIHSKPGSDVLVTVFRADDRSQPVGLGKTDAMGRFWLHDPRTGAAIQLAAGDYRVILENPVGDWSFPNEYHSVDETPLRPTVVDAELLELDLSSDVAIVAPR
jgi:hypothetical protein